MQCMLQRHTAVYHQCTTEYNYSTGKLHISTLHVGSYTQVLKALKSQTDTALGMDSVQNSDMSRGHGITE